MAKKMNWRADLQKIRNNREKADNAAKRAEEKAKKLAGKLLKEHFPETRQKADVKEKAVVQKSKGIKM